MTNNFASECELTEQFKGADVASADLASADDRWGTRWRRWLGPEVLEFDSRWCH